jgi:hypothetical protein
VNAWKRLHYGSSGGLPELYYQICTSILVYGSKIKPVPKYKRENIFYISEKFDVLHIWKIGYYPSLENIAFRVSGKY